MHEIKKKTLSCLSKQLTANIKHTIKHTINHHKQLELVDLCEFGFAMKKVPRQRAKVEVICGFKICMSADFCFSFSPCHRWSNTSVSSTTSSLSTTGFHFIYRSVLREGKCFTAPLSPVNLCLWVSESTLEHPADRFARISKHISGISSLYAFLDASVVAFHITFNQTAIYVRWGCEAELKLPFHEQWWDHFK